MKKKERGFDSLAIHESKTTKLTRSHQLPLYLTSSFEFDSINEGIDVFTGKKKLPFYSRYGNPTVEAVGKKIAKLEVYGSDLDAVGIMTSSGMSAISTLLLAILKKGDHLLTQGNLYGGSTELLTDIVNNFGIKTTFINLQNLALVEKHLKKNKKIKLVYFETPANPTLACVDIKGLTTLCKKYGVKTAIDNTFCTPYLQKPLLLGADFTIHSTTKFLNGHGNSIAGVIIGTNKEFMQKKVWKTMKLLGSNCSPFEAWLTNNGLKTLAVRMDRHCENAGIVANYLDKHPKVDKVNYTGLKSHPDHKIAKKQMSDHSSMMSFELKGGFKNGVKFMERIKFCTFAPTLGDVDTLILHPASMSHINVPKKIRERNGITDGLIRLSVGIENVEDIITDLHQALDAV